jgi:integrase
LLTVTTNAKRHEIARVERDAALLEAANVMYLKLGVGSAASRTDVAITLGNGRPHLLPTTTAPQPSSRLSVHAAAVSRQARRPPEPAHWRRDEWKPALTAAGLDYRKPYALRHTFVSECIAAGIATFEIARMAGTSVLQIEKTYGHLLPDAIERGRGALDAFDVRAEAFGQLSGNAD